MSLWDRTATVRTSVPVLAVGHPTDRHSVLDAAAREDQDVGPSTIAASDAGVKHAGYSPRVIFRSRSSRGPTSRSYPFVVGV